MTNCILTLLMSYSNFSSNGKSGFFFPKKLLFKINTLILKMEIKEEKGLKTINGVIPVVSVIHLFIFHFRVPVLKPHICSVPKQEEENPLQSCSLRRLSHHTTFVVL